MTQRLGVGIAWGVLSGDLWRRGGGRGVLDMVLLAARKVVAEGSGLVPGSQVAHRGGVGGLVRWYGGEREPTRKFQPTLYHPKSPTSQTGHKRG